MAFSWPISPGGSLPVLAGIGFGVAAVFVADVLVPADSVSICFAYAIPVMLGLLAGGRTAFAVAALTTALSVFGTFIQPEGPISMVFIANRVMAVGMQWMVAGLVHYRLRAEQTMSENLEAEREKADQQRRFITILSHELKTPLTIIDGQAYRLAKLAPSLSPDELRTRTAKIRNAARRISDLVERIEWTSAAGAGALACLPQTVDLRALLEDSLHHLAEENPAAEIIYDIVGLPDDIVGDPGLLRQIFDNLLSNAVKYAGSKGRIEVSGRIEADAVVVTVADDGPGIPPDDLPHVRKLYYRGGNSHGSSGVGIGLYLVDRFAAAHGGRLSVANRPGSGAVVTVLLPLKAEPVDAEP